jgi:hypothetical protein
MRLLGFTRLINLQVAAALVVLFSLNSSSAKAHEEPKNEVRFALSRPSTAVETPRFTLYFPSTKEDSGIPLDKLAKSTLEVLDDTYEELSQQFKVRPQQKVVFRFLTPEEFRRYTGAPSWTSAMYLRGEVSIPVSKEKRPNPVELRRAIRHEYTHAVVAELSGKRCPAWLDEGLAQMMEGDVNPLLGPALRKWNDGNKEAMPLEWLQNGFMGLNEQIVPAAYAQSLFSTRLIIDRLGYTAVLKYLDQLRKGETETDAFRVAFGLSSLAFEQKLALHIANWAKSSEVNP